MKKRAMTWVACLVVAGSAGAQTVWHVGPGRPIQDLKVAIGQAAPGDIILTEVGSSSGLLVDKGLTIVGLLPPPAPVVVKGPSNQTGITGQHFHVFDIPPGQHARIVNVRFDVAGIIGGFIAGLTRVQGGSVSFERCLFEGVGNGALRVHGGADVQLLDCVALGLDGSNAVSVYNARLTIVGGSFSGGNGFFGSMGFYIDAGRGIDLTASELHVSNATISAGANFFCNVGEPGIFADRDSKVWLSDVVVTGGDCAMGAGGFAIRAQGRAEASRTVEYARSVLGAGAGTPAGTPTSNFVHPNADLLGVAAPDPLALGQPYTLTYRAGAPGVPVLLWITADLAVASTPVIAQPVWFGGTVAIFAAAGTTDAASAWTLPLVVPNDPALGHAGIWFHGVSVPPSGLPAQAAPPVGGIVMVP